MKSRWTSTLKIGKEIQIQMIISANVESGEYAFHIAGGKSPNTHSLFSRNAALSVSPTGKQYLHFPGTNTQKNLTQAIFGRVGNPKVHIGMLLFWLKWVKIRPPKTTSS